MEKRMSGRGLLEGVLHDQRMHPLEAYILAQRKGKVLEYGKH